MDGIRVVGYNGQSCCSSLFHIVQAYLGWRDSESNLHGLYRCCGEDRYYCSEVSVVGVFGLVYLAFITTTPAKRRIVSVIRQRSSVFC